MCRGQSFLVEETQNVSREEQCLNVNFRYFNVASGTLKEENPNAFDGVGNKTPEEFK